MKFFIFLLFPLSLWAQVGFDLNNYVRSDSRFRQGSSENSIQVRQKYRIYLEACDFKLVSSLATGGAYNSEWNDLLKAFDGKGYNFHLRNLFAEYQKGNLRIQLGSIPTFKDYKSSLNLDKNGWIDNGVRFELKKNQSTFEFVSGRVANITDPYFFKRQGKLNYVEFEVTRELPRDFIVELGYEFLEDHFLKAEVRKDLSLSEHHSLRVSLQSLFNINTSSKAFAAEFSVLGDRKAKFLSKLDWVSRLICLDRDLGVRGDLIDEFRFLGTQFTTEVSYVPNSNVSIFLRNIHNLGAKDTVFNNRINLGIRHNISSKKAR